MDFFMTLVLFGGSTFLLVKSADFFIENAEKLGISLKLPHFITGILIVAVGTSLPEFATSISSVLKGEADMLAGNVLGTVIANIFLGLGLVSVIARQNIKFKHNIFQVHFPIFVFSVALLTLCLMDKQITSTEGFFFLAICGAYLWFLFSRDKVEFFPHHERFSWKLILFAFIGLLGLVISSEFVVRSILSLATILGAAKTALSATLVAVGTSLPEMMVVFAALKRKNFDMAVGNILGSNIFDILLIFGVGSFIQTITISTLTYTIILPFMLATLFIYWAVSKDKEITRQEGLAMTFFYFLFLGKLFGIV